MTTPLVCIFVAYLLVYLPHFASLAGRARLAGGFDNRHPRDQVAKLEGWSKRAVAAHQNGFEAFAPFAASVLVAHVGHGDPAKATTYAIVFVVARALYPIAYIANVHLLRSALWFAGFVATVALFLLPLFS